MADRDHGMINQHQQFRQKPKSTARSLTGPRPGHAFHTAGCWCPFATIICLVFVTVGCQTPGQATRNVVHRDPVIPLSISRADLVEHLNSQSQDLNGWRCMSTKLHARLPGVPDQRLSGYIACQSPQYFRLTADNLIVKADLGSNADHCWVYLKPGRSEVLKWNHEDTALLQRTQPGIPSIDPNWLMLVLGITPLDANDYDLNSSPTGQPELTLTATEQAADGSTLRRIIRIDALQGVIRKHEVYDCNTNLLVSAELNRHQRQDGHLIPTSVKLSFPQTKTELTLSFQDIETNPHLPDHYWHMPDKNLRVVDLGKVIRSQMPAQQPVTRHSSGRVSAPRVSLQPPVFHRQPDQSAFAETEQRMIDGTVAADVSADIEEPDWDTPNSDRKTAGQPTAYQTPPAKRKRWWRF